MRISIILTLLLAMAVSVSAQTPAKNEKKPVTLEPSGTPKMEFKVAHYDFGTIKQGQKVSYVFKFTNTGNAPLIIQSTGTSCGCTTPEYSKEPIMPGEEGEITVTFDSAGKIGTQDKSIRIFYNNTEQSPALLSITCVVEKDS